MKIIYVDTLKNIDIFTEDNPYCKIRVIFKDDGNLFVYYSDDVNSKTYINRIINTKKHPHIFYIANMDTIESEEQYNLYDSKIQELYNFQGLVSDQKIDGNEIL